MNNKSKNILRNLNYTITANFIVLGISVLLSLIVPKYLGVKEYGFWQLYVFYSSYVGFFHFGWLDGIYLKIGGEEYKQLDKSSLGTQFYYLFIFQFLLSALLCLYAFLFQNNNFDKQIVWLAIACLLVVSNLRSFILFIFQSTNRIKVYAQLSRNDSYLYMIGALGYLVLGGRNFIVLVLIDLISKIIVTIWGVLQIKDIVFAPRYDAKTIFPEIVNNIFIGSNLMLGNIASLLVLGISRFLVEKKWGIETFGKLSFALGISNIFMMFVTSTSVVLYPILRRTDQSNLSNLYSKVRSVFLPFSLVLLLFFNPIRIILEWWLPNYKVSLFYMGILFPMVVYEGRNSLMINTYLKTIRKERVILTSNLVTLCFVLFMSFSSIYIFNNINLAVISIVLSIIFRTVLAETVLAKILGLNFSKDNSIEFFLVIIFILGNMYLSAVVSFIIYFISILFYLLINYKKIKEGVIYFYSMMKVK